MLTTLVHSMTGAVHLLSALTAMGLGTTVLLLNKGTKRHTQVGYGYVMAMILVNATAFMIYHLYGTFGPFHLAALFSGISIAGGMVPVFFRRRISSWLHYHYFFTNWSVVGLYAAFWAETLVRLFPMKQFWPVVVLATSLTTGIGSYLINRNKARMLRTDKVVTAPSLLS